MTPKVKPNQVRMGGACFSLPFILSFATEKDWLEVMMPEYFLHKPEADRKEILKSFYKEAKRLQKSAKKEEPKPEIETN